MVDVARESVEDWLETFRRPGWVLERPERPSYGLKRRAQVAVRDALPRPVYETAVGRGGHLDRASKLVPEAKLIFAFRNPVDRAYSQFQMSRREAQEPLETFEEAVAREAERLQPEIERSERDRRYNSWPLGNWSYLYRSRYAE